MADISFFFWGFILINAVALALFVIFAATTATRFFATNRRQRIARSERLVPYYGHLALGH